MATERKNYKFQHEEMNGKNRDIANNVSSTIVKNHPMFLRQLTFLPPNHPALLRASYSTRHFTHPAPTLHPWWSVRGFPPWPPHLPHSHQPHRFLSNNTAHFQSTHPSNFTPRWRSFHASTGLMMEYPEREPPHKRRKSAENKTSERERHREVEPGATQGKTRRESRSLDTTTAKIPRSNHRCKDGSGDRGKTREGKGGDSQESSTDKDTERTRSGRGYGNGGSQRKNSVVWGTSQDGTPDHIRSAHEKGGKKDMQPKSGEQDPVPKANPWFKQRAAGEGSKGPNKEGPQEDQVDRINEVGSQRDFPPLLHTTIHPSSYSRPPAPPGSCPPFRQQDNVKLVRPLQRHWEVSPACSSYHEPPGVSTVFDFSVLSYNILSQDLLHDNAYLYQHCNPSILPWDYRLPNLLAEIQNYNADILCLQEVQEDHYENQIKPALQALGYQSNTHLLYNPRRGDIKLAQLAVLLAEISRLSHLPDGSTNPVLLCGDFNSIPGSPLYSFLTKGCLKYRGMPMGMVSGQESSARGQRLLTVPIWSPSLGINQNCQYEKQSTESCSPTVVEGAISNLTVEDLTAKAAAAAYNRAQIQHSLKLRSSYHHRLMHDGRPEITTCHSRTAMTVDYILYSPDVLTSASLPGGRGLRLLGRLSLVGYSELMEINGLPNQHHSSDHLPLLAHFRLKR
ncbi:hypothetical protein LDENG_00046340 [Lucifuga dentata]|nr:hypothetical protein LDENG_00046340 [Lucifuga dentata]